MDFLFKIPIRLQIVIIVLIVALPAAAIIIYSGVQQRNHAINEARVDAQRLVDRIASEQRILVASALQLVVSVSQLPDVSAKDSGKVNLFLNHLLKLHPKLSVLFIADRTGYVWASSDHITDSVTIYDRRYFKNAITSGQLASGEFHISRILKKPLLTFGYPYKNSDGDIIGVVGAGIFLNDYKYLLEKTNLPSHSNIILLDYKGSVLFSAVNSDKFTGKIFDRRSFNKMKEGPDNNSLIDIEATDKSLQDECFVYYQRLRLEGELSPYMYVRVEIPVKSALAQANIEIVRNMSMFSMVLALAFAASWIVGKRSIADRIIMLKTASRNMANGDVRIRVSDLVKGGELGELGESFDSMAQQISLREKNLSDSQLFLNTIIDTEPDCVEILDNNGCVLMINPAGLKILGVESIDQFEGQSIFSLISPKYREAFIKLTNDVFQGLSGQLEFEADNLDGKHLWLGTHVVPLRDDAGEIVSLLGITRDITDRKLIEEALSDKLLKLQNLKATLENRIENAVADSRKKDQLLIQQGRNAALGEMISNIAHQWRQPLNTLGLIVQELQLTYGRNEFNKDYLKDNVNKAMNLINHMSKTINDFSNYFKPDKEKTCFNVGDAITRTLALIGTNLKNINVTTRLEIIGNVNVVGYVNEYSQVILNILLNCRDAFEICSIVGNFIIKISIQSENNKSVVIISDNAGGIKKDIIDKIFDPYFTTKGPDKGTGIGLYMAKNIIEKNMGGKLTVRNTNDGAEFRIEV